MRISCHTGSSVSSTNPSTNRQNDEAVVEPSTTAAHASSTSEYRSSGLSARTAEPASRPASTSSYHTRTKLMPPALATTTASGASIGSDAPSASTRIASVRSLPSGATCRTDSGTAHFVSSSGRDGE